MKAAAAWPALGLLLAVATASADDTMRAQVEQRVRLTARLIGDAGTGQRISASGHARAVSHLDEGRLHQSLAEQALAAGDLPTARREVDEALRHIGMARRLVPDAPARQAEARQRHQQRLAALDRLLEAWQGHASASTADVDGRVAAAGLIGNARRLGEERRYDEAAESLTLAEHHVLTGMNRLLHQRTIDYTSRAETPQQQFQLTLARHDGLAELVPVALSELRPGPDASSLVERYTDTSRTLRQQALQRQQRGELLEALADLQNAVLYVQRALSAAGVNLPAGTP